METLQRAYIDVVAHKLGVDPKVVAHSIRFRPFGNGYPRAVTMAYGRDIARAAEDDDETVWANVRTWLRAQGIDPRWWMEEPRDWMTFGDEDEVA